MISDRDKGQTQIGDVSDFIGPDDIHDIQASRFTLAICFDQPQIPPHVSSHSRRIADGKHHFIVHTPKFWTVPAYGDASAIDRALAWSTSHFGTFAVAPCRSHRAGHHRKMGTARGAGAGRGVSAAQKAPGLGDQIRPGAHLTACPSSEQRATGGIDLRAKGRRNCAPPESRVVEEMHSVTSRHAL